VYEAQMFMLDVACAESPSDAELHDRLEILPEIQIKALKKAYHLSNIDPKYNDTKFLSKVAYIYGGPGGAGAKLKTQLERELETAKEKIKGSQSNPHEDVLALQGRLSALSPKKGDLEMLTIFEDLHSKLPVGADRRLCQLPDTLRDMHGRGLGPLHFEVVEDMTVSAVAKTAMFSTKRFKSTFDDLCRLADGPAQFQYWQETLRDRGMVRVELGMGELSVLYDGIRNIGGHAGLAAATIDRGCVKNLSNPLSKEQIKKAEAALAAAQERGDTAALAFQGRVLLIGPDAPDVAHALYARLEDMIDQKNAHSPDPESLINAYRVGMMVARVMKEAVVLTMKKELRVDLQGHVMCANGDAMWSDLIFETDNLAED
jgi:hypothetical protein